MKVINQPSVRQSEYVDPTKGSVEVVRGDSLPIKMDDFEQRFTATFTGLVGNTHSIYNGMSPRTLSSIEAVNASASFDVDNPSIVNINITIKHK